MLLGTLTKTVTVNADSQVDPGESHGKSLWLSTQTMIHKAELCATLTGNCSCLWVLHNNATDPLNPHIRVMRSDGGSV